MSDILCDLANGACESSLAEEKIFIMDDHEEEGEEGEEMEKEEKEEKGDEKKDSGDITADQWLYVSKLSQLAMASPMMANMTLATVAGMWAGSGALELFRWRKDYVISGTTTKYYAAGEYDTDKTEWWKLSDMLRNYGALGIGGMLALTSMLAALGVMPGINLMAWMWLGAAATLLEVVVFTIRLIGYEDYHKDSRGTDATKAAGGAAMVEIVRSDWIRDELSIILSLLAVYSVMDDVVLGYWMSMSGDAQQEELDSMLDAATVKFLETKKMREEKGLTGKKEEEDEEEEEEEGEEGDEAAEEETE